MKVKELIEKLSKLPEDIDIKISTQPYDNTSLEIKDIITGNKKTINKLKSLKYSTKILQKGIER